ncbi:putative alcohol oxidase [Rostrohypoxylon terebratum]|nr:putative alcohol oxidase [Rostrohypoxylon terebratum]
MGLYTKLPEEIREVDVIFVGGGCTSCITASRLSDADPTLSILVIESGQNNYDLPTVTYPGFWYGHLTPGNKHTSFFQGPKSEHLAGRQATVPTGHILGGGSSINMALYSRAQRSDYDSWKVSGWSAYDLLPYMKRDRHGFDSPIEVSGSRFRSPRLESDFINALGELGWPEIEDINTLDHINGVMRAVRYVNPDGRRQDTAHKYLHPRLQDGKHPNLHVLVESQATGVTYRPNPAFQSTEDSSKDNIRMLKARKMIILSAGPLGTPLVLERSGVGDPQILKRAGVPIVSNHFSMMYGYESTLKPEETLEGIISGRLSAEKLIKADAKVLGWNSVDCQAKLRPTDTDIAGLGPEFQETWDNDFKDFPDKPLMMMSAVAGIPPKQNCTIVTFNLYPSSRGHLHITGPKIDDVPDFDPGALSDPQAIDLKSHVWMYKKHREIVHRMGLLGDELPGMHPTFSADSKAIKTAAGKFEYTVEDDQIIEDWIRGHLDSTWHPIGTCKMAPREEFGVVDPVLNVYGVQGLKIADMSIPTANIGANLANTAMTIGERAADILIRELGAY